MRGRTPSAAIVLGITLSATARARPPSPEELRVVEQRLGPLTPASRQLVLARGDTAFVEQRVLLPDDGPALEAHGYLGRLVEVKTGRGLSMARRVDRLRIVGRGARQQAVYTYAITVGPAARGRARVGAVFELARRKRPDVIVARRPIAHEVEIRPPEPSLRDLAADFVGYRLLRPRVEHRAYLLSREGLPGLSVEDERPIPTTAALDAEIVERLRAWERERRRMWIARRHLQAAARAAPSPRIRTAAAAFLQNLDQPRDRWAGLPSLALLPPEEPGGEEEPDGERARAGATEPSTGGTLEPVAEYAVGSEGTVEVGPAAPPSSPPAAPGTPAPRDAAPRDTAPGDPAPRFEPGDPASDPRLLAISEGMIRVPSDNDERIRTYHLPVHRRGLLLAGANIAHGGAVRTSYAEVTGPESASTVATFFSAQVGLTHDLGLEVTVPTQLVSITVGGLDDSLYRPGNPAVSAKYRFSLPALGGRRSALTARARWSVAAFLENRIPTTQLTAEQFTRLPNFADVQAFLLEKTGLGVGASWVWDWRWFRAGAELGFDYFFPLDIAVDRQDFLGVSYGASLGAFLPGDALGLVFEGRGVSLVPLRRTEVFLYGGLRARLFEVVHPAVWVGHPVGPAGEVTGVQAGAELRISFDLPGVVRLSSLGEGRPLLGAAP